MVWGPGPGTASGYQGEARKTLAAGQRRQRLKARKGGSSEDHLGISWADFGFIRSPASAGMGLLNESSSAGGEAPEPIALSRAVTRSLPAELRQVYQGWPGRLGCPSELGQDDRTPIRVASDTRGKKGPGGRSDHSAVVGN
jgi:hypothetical protein